MPGYHGTLFDIQKQAVGIYNQTLLQKSLPRSLLTVEIIREIGTMIMLWSVAFIAATKIRERFAIFLWAFAFWDIFYYVFLFLTVRWPENFTTTDVLFLIPEPWFSQVWFPILISSLTMIAIFFSRTNKK